MKRRLVLCFVALGVAVSVLYYKYSPGQRWQRLMNAYQTALRTAADTQDMSLMPAQETGLLDALRIAESFGSRDEHERLAQTLEALGGYYDIVDRPNEALLVYRRLAELRQQNPYVESVLSVQSEMGRIYEDQGKYAEAEAAYRRAVQECQKRQGEEADQELSSALFDLGLFYRNRGRWSEAVPALERSVALGEKVLQRSRRKASGAKSTQLAISLEGLCAATAGLLVIKMESYAAALEQVDRGREAAEVRTRAEALKKQYGESTTDVTSGTGRPVPNRDSVEHESEKQTALRLLEVVQWTFTPCRGMPGENTYEVSGELKNKSSQRFQGVYLDVALYDESGRIVATSAVHAANIGPGETGIISGYVIDKTRTKKPRGRIRVSTGF